MKIHVVYLKDIELFEIYDLEIKSDHENLLTFEFHKNIGTGQIDKSKLDKTIRLKNERGLAIFTLDKKKLREHIKLMSKTAYVSIDEIQRKAKYFKNHVKLQEQKYTSKNNDLW